MIMKRHRLHPQMGHSMHYIRLVRGEKHCTQRVIELENIVVENNAFHVCISLFLCTVKHLFVSVPKKHSHSSQTDCTGEFCGVTLTGTSFQYHLEGD